MIRLQSLRSSLGQELFFFLWQHIDHFHQAPEPMHLATLCHSQMISVYQVLPLFIPNDESFLQCHYPLSETIINLSVRSEFEQFSLILDLITCVVTWHKIYDHEKVPHILGYPVKVTADESYFSFPLSFILASAYIFQGKVELGADYR